MEALTRFCLAGLLLFLLSCSHSPPQLVQVFDQVDRVFDPTTQAWTARLSVFVQASSADGNKVFDRLHLIHDGQGVYFTLGKSQWTVVERPGEYWIGARDLAFPDGKVPRGDWRALLVTRSGQKVETTFRVPPVPADAHPPRGAPVRVQTQGTPGHYEVFGWVGDYLVWALDAKGSLVGRLKTLGPTFQIPRSATSVILYSYDKDRGEGLEAGPFPVQDNS